MNPGDELRFKVRFNDGQFHTFYLPKEWSPTVEFIEGIEVTKNGIPVLDMPLLVHFDETPNLAHRMPTRQDIEDAGR